MAEEFLRVESISKSFAGVQALKDVSITLNKGEVSALVGENGSGKSTLIKIIAGVYTPDEGSITIDGVPYPHLHPIDSIRAGIQIIYQDFSLFPNLTVAENIALNGELAQGKRFVNWREVRAVAQEAMERIEVRLPLNARVEQMGVADKQLIAIARAILQNAQLIIMDEPTTALTEREVEALFRVIRNLQEKGISVLFVSHKLNEVLEISEKIVVLRNGEKIVDAAAQELDFSQIVFHMTGHDVEESGYDYTPDADVAPRLKVESLTRTGSFEDISFELKPGEIVGITGLLGSGRGELALALFGVRPADSGQINIDGQPVAIKSIQDAIDNKVGYVPEDRLTEGLFLPRSIGNNIIVRTITDTLNRLGLIDGGEMRDEINKWVQDLSIKTDDPTLPARSLSGGNQQRVVLAKWLAAEPRILILNGPTVGVDIGSKTELHHIIKDLARRGMAILVISDEVPELMHTCNRVLLMRRGRLVEEFITRDITQDYLSAKLREAV